MDTFADLMTVLWSTDKIRFAENLSRLDFWLYELIAAFTGNRPGAMINGQRKIPLEARDENFVPEPDLLKYDDIRFSLIQPEGYNRAELVVEITFNRTKGGNGRVKP